MNIAFTYPSPFNPTLGGVERVTDVLCREFQRRGHKVYYFHHRDADKYHGFAPPASTSFSESADFTSPEARKSYHNFLKDNAIEIVINQCGLFSDSVLYTDVHVDGMVAPKVISVLHADPLLNYNHLFSQIAPLRNSTFIEPLKRIARCIIYPHLKKMHLQGRIQCTRYAQEHSDALVILSEGYKKYIKMLCGDIFNNEKLFTIPNPLPPCSAPVDSTSKKPWLLYVGRFDFGQKRPDRLIKIWARLYKQFPEWELHIIGDGPYRVQLERLARNFPRIFIEGWQATNQYYQQAKILLLTSNFEGFPMVLPEAMAHGVVPILFNSFAAATDIVDDQKNGILAPPFNIYDYVKKISGLMKSNSYWAKMSELAQLKAKQFKVENIADKWVTLIEALFQNSSRQSYLHD